MMDKSKCLTEPVTAEEPSQMKDIPEGWRETHCYTNGKQVKILYDALDIYPNEDHNCDEEGCGTLSHVITFDLPKP